MDCTGQNIPSNLLTVKFRTNENSEKVMNILKKFHNNETNMGLICKIVQENSSIFIIINTNLTTRPIKLLIDTGASISLIAIDVILNNIQKSDFIIDLWGITGTNNTVKTLGVVNGVSEFGDQLFGISLHTIERKYAGVADGYLGFDFLSQNNAIINIADLELHLNTKTSTNGLNTRSVDSKLIDTENNNFLHILANSYEFPNQVKYKNPERKNKQYREYFKTVNFFRQKIEKKKMDKISTNISSFSTITPLETQNKPTFNEIPRGTGTEFFENNIDKKILDRSSSIYEKLDLTNCTQQDRNFIWNLCCSFPCEFYVEGDIRKTTDIRKHEIKLIPGSKTINVRQYRIPQTHKIILEKILREYEDQGLIEKCQSSYNSPVILVEKKKEGNGIEYRLVIDFRKLNEITELTNFPIPLIDDIINGLSGCKFFSTLDIKGAFHQILLEESSRDYTAFTAGNFQYRWICMPMGLTAAPLTWQRAINTILANLIGKGVYVYLDDIIVYAHTREEHNKILWNVMQLLSDHNIQLKISKCIFFAKQFTYLGHIISENGIQANPKKLDIIKNYPKPTNVKQIQSFLGLCSYFRRYVRNFARIARGLSMLLRKEQPFLWTHIQQKSFNDLKQALVEQVTLEFPDFNQLFYVTTDASDIAIGAMLSQGELPNDRPIFFFSRVLNDTQKRYSTIQKELLAIVEAVKTFRPYLYGRFFVLITDHRPLCYLFNMKDCGSRLFRQKLELLDYNFKILYRKGSQNHVADALSRLKPLSINEILEIEKQSEKCFALTRAQARKELEHTTNDGKNIIEEKNGTILNKRSFDLIFHFIPEENDELQTKLMNKFGLINFPKNWHNFNNYHYLCKTSNQFSHIQNTHNIQNLITSLLKICKEKHAENIAINVDYENLRHYIFLKNLIQNTFTESNILITIFQNKIIEIIEKEDIDTILDLYHKSLLGGHIGADKMFNTISKFYKWDNMAQTIRDYVKKCDTCEKTKITTNTKIPMQISSLGDCLFDHTFIDFVGPISPLSTDGHRYIFTAICDLTKFLIAVPTKDCTALTAAMCLIENILLRYNFPTRLISDNASSFHSQIMKEINNIFKIKKIFTTPYHAQSNIVERSHRTLNSYLRAFTSKNNDIWHDLLIYATFAYNNSIHTTTGYTPHELAHGFRIQIPHNLTKQKLSYNYDNLADIIRNNIAKSLEIAKEHLNTRKLSNKNNYDKNAQALEINVNDLVFLKTQNKTNKFQNVYLGPYKVIDTTENYVEILRDNKSMKVHKNLIKKAHSNNNNSIFTQFPIVLLKENEINDFI